MGEREAQGLTMDAYQDSNNANNYSSDTDHDNIKKKTIKRKRVVKNH